MSRTKRFLQRPYLPALIGYLLLAALFYLPILSGLRTFPDGDFTYHFLPFSLFQRSELLAGRLPLWNPYTYGGHPFLADTQAAVFYPLSNLLLGLTLPWSSPGARLYWLEVEAVLQVALAGFFTYLLVRDLTGRRAAAFLAGSVFAFSGYLTGYPPLQLAVLRTAIWLPLLLWLLLRAFAGPGRWVWWIGASMAYTVAFLAGHPQTFLYISYTTVAWIALLLFHALRRPASAEKPRLQAYLIRIGAFYLLFLALSAAQMLPSLEFTRLSVRANVDFDFVSGGFPLQDTWQMLIPRVLTVFSPLYAGVVALGLALIAVASLLSTRRRDTADRLPERALVLFFAVLVLMALLVSYGGNGFLYAFFYRWLPGWKLFRGQERAAYLVAFGLSVLAGYGAAALVRLSGAGRRRTIAVYGLLAAAGMLIFAVFWQVPGRSAVPLELFLRIAVVNTLLLAAWLVISWRDGWSARRWAILIVLVIADLTLTNVTTNISDLSPARKAALKPEVVALAEAVGARAQANLGLPGRVYNEYRAFDDYGMRTGVEDVWGSSPLRLARFAALFDQFPLDRMWRLTGVEHVLTWRRELFGPSELLGEYPQATDSTYLHRLPDLNPRAWVVPNIRIAEDGEALKLLGDHGFDLASTALIPPMWDRDGGAGSLEDGPAAIQGRSEVSLERVAPNHLRIRVQSEQGGLLVLSENWMPGWRATQRVDGAGETRSLPVVRADLAFLGVPIGPGTATLDLVYLPNSFRSGLAWVSVAALALLGLVVIWRRLTPRSRWLRARSLVASVPVGGLRRSALRWALPGVLLIALALRAYRLNYQELRGDEALGFFFSLSPVSEMFQNTITLQEPHPLGSYLLQKAWLQCAGHSEFALRFSSLWFGVLAVALLYRLGRKLGFEVQAAVFAAGLLALSPYAIWHSQDARMYTISMALSVASTWLALEALDRKRRSQWLAYGLVSWLGLHTHYFFGFILLAQNIFFLSRALIARGRRQDAKPWLLSQVMLGLLYLPWVIVARDTLISYRGNGDSPGLIVMLLRALSVFAAGETVPSGQRTLYALLAGILLLSAGYRLFWSGRSGRWTLWLLALYLLVPLMATWVGALKRPIFNERYLIAAAPPFWLLLSAAVFGIRGDGKQPGLHEKQVGREIPMLFRGGAILVSALVLLDLASLGRYYVDPAYSKTRGWRELAKTLRDLSSGLPSERVRLAQNFPDPTLWYYYAGPVAHVVLPPAARDPVGTAREVVKLAAAGVERVVLPLDLTPSWDDSGIASSALSEQYALILTRHAGGWPVQVYVRAPAKLTSVGASFANGAELVGAAVQAQQLIPGDVLPVYLHWDGPRGALAGTEKISLQLLSPNGLLVTQTDLPFDEQALLADVTRYDIVIPHSLSSGAYRLIVALYDPAQPGAPRVLTTAGADHVELGTLRAP